jgi:hypothetical protein
MAVMAATVLHLPLQEHLYTGPVAVAEDVLTDLPELAVMAEAETVVQVLPELTVQLTPEAVVEAQAVAAEAQEDLAL